MNKTVNINLGGIVFTIDENAYEKLNRYLDSIKSHFTDTTVRDEIIADIEARIAEMFQEKLSDKRMVVNLKDVEEIIDLMGRPEDIAGDEEEPQPKDTEEKQTQRTKKRVYRNPDDKVLGGVCSGISAYFGIDPIVLRLIFVFTVLFWGTGILLYLILWLIIPEARSAAEKLEMRGEPVNVSNIEKTIKEELDHLKEKINNMTGDSGESKKNGSRVKSFIQEMVDLTLSLLRLLFKFALKLIGVIFVIAGIMVLIGLIMAFFGSLGLASITMPFISPELVHSKWLILLGALGVLLVFGIPFLAILFKGLQILFNLKTDNKWWGYGFGSLWVFGLLMVMVTGFFLVNDFKNYYTIEQTTPLNTVYTDTLYLDLNDHYDQYFEDDWTFNFFDSRLMHEENGKMVYENVKLDVVKSHNDQVELVQMKTSRGSDKKEAKLLAESIEYEFRQVDSLLVFSPVLSFPETDSWRNQGIRLTLKVPEGKVVWFGPGTEEVIYDIDNTTNTWDGDMIGHKWLMTERGLSCLDCDDISIEYHSGRNLSAKNYTIEDFSKLDISGGFKVNVIRAEDYKVEVKGEPRDLREVEVDQNNDRLNIDYDRDFFDFNIFRKRHAVIINIHMPELEEVDFSGAVDSRVSGFDVPELIVDLSGANESIMDITTDKIFIDLSGASDLTLRGETDVMEAELSGACELNAFNFQSREASVDLSGACDANLNVSRTLEVDASGASDVLYKGNPRINSELSGACSVKKVN